MNIKKGIGVRGYQSISIALFSLSATVLSGCSLPSISESLPMGDERQSINIALVKNEKTYVFSSLGELITKINLDKKESPIIIKTTGIVEKNGRLYAEPSSLENIVNLLSGNYAIFDYTEKSFDGYVAATESDVFETKYSNESTEKIGEMVSTAKITLTDTQKTKEYKIEWNRSPNQKCIANCEELSLWSDKTYKPGEKTFIKEKFIVVDLLNIAEFYDPTIELKYVKEDEILYIITNK